MLSVDASDFGIAVRDGEKVLWGINTILMTGSRNVRLLITKNDAAWIWQHIIDVHECFRSFFGNEHKTKIIVPFEIGWRMWGAVQKTAGYTLATDGLDVTISHIGGISVSWKAVE